jgi:DNA-binding response OmpR family regulator
MCQVWGFYDVNSRTLNSTISQLRKATNYNLTITHRIGIGYQLKEDILIL